MSSGYTSALAKIAPADPANARPHGGRSSSFDGATIVLTEIETQASHGRPVLALRESSRGVLRLRTCPEAVVPARRC